MIEKTGSARWSGGLKDGRGQVSTETGIVHDAGYRFATRFEGEKGTNPEELLAAAHAACFSMALSGQLGERGMTADEIVTTATVRLEMTDGPTITRVHLDVTAKIPDADADKFREAANTAKERCPVSKLFKGAQITMDANLA